MPDVCSRFNIVTEYIAPNLAIQPRPAHYRALRCLASHRQVGAVGMYVRNPNLELNKHEVALGNCGKE
jgi:hypothetical protein